MKRISYTFLVSLLFGYIVFCCGFLAYKIHEHEVKARAYEDCIKQFVKIPESNAKADPYCRRKLNYWK